MGSLRRPRGDDCNTTDFREVLREDFGCTLVLHLEDDFLARKEAVQLIFRWR